MELPVEDDYDTFDISDPSMKIKTEGNMDDDYTTAYLNDYSKGTK
jgi:hypothetical protein